MYYSYMPISEELVCIGFKNRNKLLLYFGVTLNKINRYVNNLLLDFSKKKKDHLCVPWKLYNF